MKKVLFWCTVPFQLVIAFLFLPVVALAIVYEKLGNSLNYFEGWCYDLPEQGYRFKDGIWVGSWEVVDGKLVEKENENH